jgi:uncharacterized protein
MIATVVNAVAVIVGSLAGILLRKKIGEQFRTVVYSAVGLISLILGIKMALESREVLILAISLVIGGLLGSWWNIEGGVLRLGDYLQKRFTRKGPEGSTTFAYGFLNASVLFCVGAMALVGSFKAGAEGDFDLILIKSVMDGFMAIMLTAAMGIGVAFSALIVLVYQGGLTLLSGFLKPLVTEQILSELTGYGGALVIMIGLGLLGLKTFKTANYLPGFILVIVLLALKPYFQFF